MTENRNVNRNIKNSNQRNIKKSISIKKPLAKKYKRRRQIVVLLPIIIILGIIGIVKLTSKENITAEINKYIVSGDKYTQQGDYNNAIKSYGQALNIDKSNKKAEDMTKILQSYVKAEADYKSGDTGSATSILNDLPADYTGYPIATEVDELKEKVSNTKGNSSKAQDDILELNNLYSSGKYKEAMAYINKVEKENLNSTQQVYVSEISNSIEQKLGKSAGKNDFTKRGRYLSELNKLVIKVNNMELSATTYPEKLKRAQDKYNVWNTELQKIINDLQNNLGPQKATELQQSEQAWEKSKTQKATEGEAKYSNPTVKQTANYQVQREMTTDRCYYLINNYM